MLGTWALYPMAPSLSQTSTSREIAGAALPRVCSDSGKVVLEGPCPCTALLIGLRVILTQIARRGSEFGAAGGKESGPPLCGSTSMSHNECTIREPIE